MMDIDSKFLWAEAAATAIYIRNRLVLSASDSMNGYRNVQQSNCKMTKKTRMLASKNGPNPTQVNLH